eukprot:jgi/Chlat1/6998/Chrsp56S06655
MAVKRWFRKLLVKAGLTRIRASVLLVGLDNGGKSTIVARIRPAAPAKAPVTTTNMLDGGGGGGDVNGHVVPSVPPTVAPTVGFAVEKFALGKFRLTVMDMSGQQMYLQLWQCYYADVQAVIFVVDATDKSRFFEAKALLHSVISHPDVGGIPLLVIANKMDLVHATPAAQVQEALELHKITDREWHLSAASALTGQGLEEGLQWVLKRIRL